MLPFELPYIDDSGNSTNSPIFVFGGFVAPVENWLAFSDQWKAALQTPPILDYFKMKEAARLKDQFDPRKGWTADLRDQRINAFAEIIHKHAVLRVSVTIKNSDFKKYIRSIPAVNRGLAADTPYITMLSLLMTAVAMSRESLNLTEPLDHRCRLSHMQSDNRYPRLRSEQDSRVCDKCFGR